MPPPLPTPPEPGPQASGLPPAPPVDGQTFFWLFFRFDGRVGRQVYWLSILFLTAVAGVSGPFAVDPESGEVLMQFGPVQSFVYTLATICSIAVSIKRLHDLNMSGLFAIGLLFFPVALIMTLWLGFRAGNGQPNKYGWEPDVRPTQPPPTVDDDA